MKVIGLAGWSGAGKTTLLTRLIPHFREQGLRVSVIKHAHHTFDVDVPGKDSWRHREAGAEEVLVSSAHRWAMMHELRGAREPRLPELLQKMSPVDLVIVEGYKSEPHRKIEVHRSANGKPLLFPGDAGIVGIASDVAVETALPTAHLDDIPAIDSNGRICSCLIGYAWSCAIAACAATRSLQCRERSGQGHVADLC